MKIESVRIENFRSFKDKTVYFNNYTCFVGPNGAGKSTVLTALNVFFRESDSSQTDLLKLVEEDFHCKETDKPITITVTFNDLSQDALDDFSNYVRQGRLVVSAKATFDPANGKAVVKQFGQRIGFKAFAPFFEADKLNKKVAELKEIYLSLKESHNELPTPKSKQQMIDALHDFESKHENDCELIPSEDEFYGVSRGKNLLTKYVQWVYVPGVKDATTEQVEEKNSALGKLLGRAVRSKINFDESIEELKEQMKDQYQILLDNNQNALDEISNSLQTRLSVWAHPNISLELKWIQDSDKSVRVDPPWAHIITGEGEFKGHLERFGHGLQRSYIFALLQELSNMEEAHSPMLLLAIEEPELYQHPPQVRYLSTVLQNLIEENSQVMVTTHNPGFVSGEVFEDVRMVNKRNQNSESSVESLTIEKFASICSSATSENLPKPKGNLAKIHQALQPSLSEMFFTRKLVLVEGLEDVAYLQTYMNLLDLTDEFRKLGCHIVPANGKSELYKPLLISKLMKIPTYLIFDSDGEEKNPSKRIMHEKDNKLLLKLVDGEYQTPFPEDNVWGKGFTVWKTDIGKIVKNELGSIEWEKYSNKVNGEYDHIGDLNKNSLFIGSVLYEAWLEKNISESLKKICEMILEEDNFVCFDCNF